jgi:16S rRNA (guanine527-N7)-methyltransferase
MNEDGRTGRPETRRAHLTSPVVGLADLADDRAKALALTPVSRETVARLDEFVALLIDWQRRINLIAASTEPILWTRHVADSLQILGLAPEARTWADLGSGGGFPGVVLACALAEAKGAMVHLVESNAGKCAFLRAAVSATGVPAVVHAMRAADFVKANKEPIAAVTARAVAPLADLLEVAAPLLINGVIGVFPKGQSVEAELTEAAKCWKVEATLAESRTDPKARIVVVKGLQAVRRPRAKDDLR